MDTNAALEITKFAELGLKLIPILVALITTAYLLYNAIVTESLFLIKHRLLEIIGLRHTFKHEKLKLYEEQEFELHTFNSRFRLNVKSPRAMDELVKWTERHIIRLDELRKCRPYFNPTHRTFDIPKHTLTKTKLILSLIFIISVFLFLYVPNAALLQVKKTGEWFWVTNEKAYSFTAYLPDFLHKKGAWTISPGNCLLDKTAAPLEDKWDKDVVCYVLLDNKQGYVTKTIKDQHSLALAASSPWLILPYNIINLAYKRRRAKKLMLRTASRLSFGIRPTSKDTQYYY